MRNTQQIITTASQIILPSLLGLNHAAITAMAQAASLLASCYSVNNGNPNSFALLIEKTNPKVLNTDAIPTACLTPLIELDSCFNMTENAKAANQTLTALNYCLSDLCDASDYVDDWLTPITQPNASVLPQPTDGFSSTLYTNTGFLEYCMKENNFPTGSYSGQCHFNKCDVSQISFVMLVGMLAFGALALLTCFIDSKYKAYANNARSNGETPTCWKFFTCQSDHADNQYRSLEEGQQNSDNNTSPTIRPFETTSS